MGDGVGGKKTTMNRLTAAVTHPSVGAALRADLAKATVSRAVVLVSVPILVFFEWGAGNDLVNIVSISSAYGSASGLRAVALAALVGFAVPMTMQTITGVVAAHGLPALHETGAHLHRRLLDRRPDLAGLSYLRLARADRWIVSVALGTTAAVLIEQVTTHVTGVRRHRRTILESAAYMAITTALVSGTIAALLEVARLNDSLEPIVEPVVDVLVNPLVWIALFATVGLLRFATGRTLEGADR